MSTLKQFAPPANLNDFPENPALEEAFRTEWSNNVNRWTETGILGDPWTVLFDNNRVFYYNPLSTDISNGTPALISWIAFPNRILVTYPGASIIEQWGYADGTHADGTFGPPPPVNGQPYSPEGPRGWQDEYCEWIVTRNDDGKIARIDFTCENPEYWYTLWRIDPGKVLSLYRDLVDPAVQLEDLYLLDRTGNPVIDRITGLPAYNITNKWNNQPSADGKTGAVHLISPPNTLGAEIYLGAAATLLRDNPPGTPVTDPEALIQCSRYGTANRNSDPHIGATINGVIRGGGVQISLEDPVGLYIQTPNFGSYRLPRDPNLPPGAQPSDCWQIIRGQESIEGYDGNFILHAQFELPQEWVDAGVSFTIDDITIQGNPIQYGAQLTQTFQIALRGLTIESSLPAEQPLPCQAPNPNPLPAPQQLMDLNLLLAGSTSTAATVVEAGLTTPNIGLIAFATKQGATVDLGDGVTTTVTNFLPLGGNQQLLILAIAVDANASAGDRNLLLTNPDGSHGPAAPGLLTVVPQGTLGQAAQPAAAPPAVERLAVAAVDELDLSQIQLPPKRQ